MPAAPSPTPPAGAVGVVSPGRAGGVGGALAPVSELERRRGRQEVWGQIGSLLNSWIRIHYILMRQEVIRGLPAGVMATRVSRLPALCGVVPAMDRAWRAPHLMQQVGMVGSRYWCPQLGMNWNL